MSIFYSNFHFSIPNSRRFAPIRCGGHNSHRCIRKGAPRSKLLKTLVTLSSPPIDALHLAKLNWPRITASCPALHATQFRCMHSSRHRFIRFHLDYPLSSAILYSDGQNFGIDTSLNLFEHDSFQLSSRVMSTIPSGEILLTSDLNSTSTPVCSCM